VRLPAASPSHPPFTDDCTVDRADPANRLRCKKRGYCAACQCDSRAGNGCGTGRELGTSRHADGNGRDRSGAVDAASASQSFQPGLAESRPLRAVQRPRLDAAVRAAAPHGLCPAARGDSPLPPARLDDARTSGAGPDSRCGDDLGTAGPGIGQRRRHSAGGAPSRRAVQSSRALHRRPPNLRVRGRWLHDGRHFARGLLVRGHAAPGQARLLLRRQRYIDRRGSQRLVHRRHSGALRGVRLAGHPACRRPRCGCRRRGDSRGARERSAHAHLLQDGHRQGLAQPSRN